MVRSSQIIFDADVNIDIDVKLDDDVKNEPVARCSEWWACVSLTSRR